MSASLGNLDSLLNLTFAGDELSGVAIQSFTLAGGDPTELEGSIASVVATATGPYFASTNYTIVAVSNTLNTLTITSSLPTETYNVIAFTGNAIFLGYQTNSANFAYLLNAGDASIADGVAFVLSTSGLPSGTSLSFAAGATYDGSASCFARGTFIRCERGEVAVEDLQVGDRVVSALSGRLRRVLWIGTRTVAARRHPRPWDVNPVRVRAGAFGAGMPRRNLVLSPDHAVKVGTALVPIRYLLDGATIVQEPTDKVTYFHVELDGHDVLFAEGLPAESYLDTGNRGSFENAPGPVELVPDFSRRIWATRGCLPLLTEGATVEDARRRLTARAHILGWRQTNDPGLRVLADGRPIIATRSGQRWRAELPPGACTARLLSRAGVPAEMVPGATDCRRLGVALANVRLDRVPVPNAAFGVGWHAPEPDWRWTDGTAELALNGARELLFELACGATYWQAPPIEGRHLTVGA